jgi:hypothetical protein
VAKLPIRGVDHELFVGFSCIKISADAEKGLVFMSTIRKLNGKTSSALLNFSGEITEKEQEFN